MTDSAIPARRPLRRRPLGTLLLLLGLLTALGGVYAALAPSSGAVPTSGPEAAAAGKALFQENCSTCHGLSGEGSSYGPTLVGVGAASVDFQVGTGRMPLARPGAQASRGRVQFAPEQIAQMAAYVATLGPGPAIPSAADVDYTKGNAALGGEIFRTNCSMCHNFAGAGGALTHGKYAPSLTKTTPAHVYEALVTGPQAMPVFSDDQITPQQKRDIIAYLEAQRQDKTPGLTGLGTLGPTTEGLFGWVIGIGLLIACAVWLAQKAR
ncbi:menaquinol-cytochrome c reductase cytochrome c1 subunit precursor [Motilibacter rhizosphaerae]|uniref:Cytochrome bc1 complex cytochrome c subunit n=1 Tax=Motilibacter rhizosphaerae TaxID=598652 RepID=A0A4V2F4J6_9ACTN|nr:c-type cytochrome [Motilibacter rhizosphaerae]RZS89549.1 menaquinol-cytochrome c reductase cytochrome c1 subunit precursor [Motilibacter rhizosphaerae]